MAPGSQLDDRLQPNAGTGPTPVAQPAFGNGRHTEGGRRCSAAADGEQLLLIRALLACAPQASDNAADPKLRWLFSGRGAMARTAVGADGRHCGPFPQRE